MRPIVPRLAPGGAVTLLLPWDPDYSVHGIGEGEPLAKDHPLGGGPSRFVLEGNVWRLT